MKLKPLQLAPQFQLSSWLSQIQTPVGMLVIGRFLSEVGTGFTLFYAPIFFVNQVGLSATTVGIALTSTSLAGVVGRILGGSLADTREWGRRRTLLLATGISAVGSLVLATTSNFMTLVIGSAIVGLGIGFYWPASEAVVADGSQMENRREIFALTRVADNLGLAIGSVLAGLWIAIAGNYRGLFIIDAISFMVFFAVIYLAINETSQPQIEQSQPTQPFGSWLAALSDRRLLIYVAVNITFTTYISQLHSTLPIYFKNFIRAENNTIGLAETTISALYAWHLILAVICQFPIARALKSFSHTLALTISAILWAIGFGCVWMTAIAPHYHLVWVSLALTVFALALVSYTPFAASLVTDLAPETQRGVYFSINSLCWALGHFVGSPLGGWALDRSRIIADNFWFGFSLSVLIPIVILQYLNKILSSE
ncbi:MDR family MFS transporter [Calothrix sp. NIES-2098]|uniref:MDR family MFS transporter n=1 Tax=Calothrix sp. NIES-2098 TaxID=1954171 RepID=UPI000B6218F3|nr:major facilitator transporter [Calothrix sp. NIES-2098]